MELLDVVDENNRLTGEQLDREIIHEKGLFHREVAIWIVNEKGEILVQKRAAYKKQSPNKWALTAGHIEAGEEPLDVAIRETEEELGFKVPKDEMKFLFICKRKKKFSEHQYNNHFKYVYYTKTNRKISEFVLQQEEVSEVKYITISELEEINQRHNEEYVFESSDYIEQSISYLKNILSKS